MRDSTVIWAGYAIVGDSSSSPVVWSGSITAALARLVEFVQTYQMVKGFVFTIARKESEVNSRLARLVQDRAEPSVRGESLAGLLSRLSTQGLDSIDNTGEPAPAAKDESTTPNTTSHPNATPNRPSDATGDSIEDFLAQLKESPE